MNAEHAVGRRRIGHLGPPGTHGEEALRAALTDATDAWELVALDSNGDVVRAVESGAVEAGFVPIENSVEGAVTETIDALVHDAPGVRIVGEIVWPAHHSLIAAGPLALEEITTVASHPQALAQCQEFISRELPNARRLAQVSTAEAVRDAIEQNAGRAAIGSHIAAEIYGGTVLAEKIEDSAGNKTRFVWLARGEDSPWTPPADTVVRTSLVFSGFNDTSPGGLVGILNEFAERDVNMSKIESRPQRTSLGHYLFFVDLDGAEDAPAIAGAINGVAQKVDKLRVLGCYHAYEG